MLRSPEQVLEMLLQTGAIPADTVSGCSQNEIDALEEAFGIQLPVSFKQFLQVMGKVENSRQGFFQEYYPFDLASIDAYIECRNKVKTLLKERGHTLTKADFVFLSSSNNCWCWFDTKAGNEPAINYVMDDLEEVQLSKWENFLAFLNYVAEEFFD